MNHRVNQETRTSEELNIFYKDTNKQNTLEGPPSQSGDKNIKGALIKIQIIHRENEHFAPKLQQRPSGDKNTIKSTHKIIHHANSLPITAIPKNYQETRTSKELIKRTSAAIKWTSSAPLRL